METRLYNGQNLDGVGSTLSISARGDTMEEIRMKLYNEAKRFFGYDYKVLIPDDIDMIITTWSDKQQGKYFASAYVKGIRKSEAAVMAYRQD